jgi:hypothetical protein
MIKVGTLFGKDIFIDTNDDAIGHIAIDYLGEKLGFELKTAEEYDEEAVRALPKGE